MPPSMDQMMVCFLNSPSDSPDNNSQVVDEDVKAKVARARSHEHTITPTPRKLQLYGRGRKSRLVPRARRAFLHIVSSMLLILYISHFG